MYTGHVNIFAFTTAAVGASFNLSILANLLVARRSNQRCAFQDARLMSDMIDDTLSRNFDLASILFHVLAEHKGILLSPHTSVRLDFVRPRNSKND